MLNVPSMRDQVSDEEWQLRCDLAACYRLVAAYGWSDLVFTHISAKLPESVSHGEEHCPSSPWLQITSPMTQRRYGLASPRRVAVDEFLRKQPQYDAQTTDH